MKKHIIMLILIYFTGILSAAEYNANNFPQLELNLKLDANDFAQLNSFAPLSYEDTNFRNSVTPPLTLSLTPEDLAFLNNLNEQAHQIDSQRLPPSPADNPIITTINQPIDGNSQKIIHYINEQARQLSKENPISNTKSASTPSVRKDNNPLHRVKVAIDMNDLPPPIIANNYVQKRPKPIRPKPRTTYLKEDSCAIIKRLLLRTNNSRKK